MIEIEKLLNKIPLSTIDQFNGKQVRFDDVVNLFKDKVIIQRGETIQVQEEDGWDDLFTMSENKEYRIKPKEHVYEWQCIYKLIHETLCSLTTHMTEPEIMNWKAKHGKNFIIKPIEETKRERK